MAADWGAFFRNPLLLLEYQVTDELLTFIQNIIVKCGQDVQRVLVGSIVAEGRVTR